MITAEYRCPKCKGAVSLSRTTPAVDGGYGDGKQAAYRCQACHCDYPIVDGIADFRVYPDPYIDLEADRQKALLLADKARELSFAELVTFYYSITPEVPADLAKYYTNHHVAGITRGAGVLRRFGSYGLSAPGRGDLVLDLGCGTGGFLAAAAATGADLIGVDLALRWLIVARKRLEELGHENIHLVCACADYLPFPDNFADAIVAENLIEHVGNQSGLFAEIMRVRRTACRILARTVNRFAMGPEPHVGVWGVGYLPRGLMNGYVKLVKNIPYEHIHLQSFDELRASISRCQPNDLCVCAARLMPQDYQHHPAAKQALFKLYSKLVQPSSPVSALIANVGPYLDVVSKPAVVANATASGQLLKPGQGRN